MSGSESLDPKEPGDPSPHDIGVYIVVCMCAIYTYLYVYGGPKYPHMYIILLPLHSLIHRA